MEKECDVKISFNNKGLKKMFPGSNIKRDKVKLGTGLNQDFIIQCIRSSNQLGNYDTFTIDPNTIEIEGNYDQWDISMKVNVKWK